FKLFRTSATPLPVDEKDPNVDYTIDHPASAFLLDSSGRFSGTIAYGETPAPAVKRLENLDLKGLPLQRDVAFDLPAAGTG
ncbi:hypothetical protein ACC810_38725, partial [Rhizobium ruizarguesonis]